MQSTHIWYEYTIISWPETFSTYEAMLEDLKWLQEKHPTGEFVIKRRMVSKWENFDPDAV